MKRKCLSFLIPVSMLFCSCNKDTPYTPTGSEPTATELLTTHQWKYYAHVIDANNNGILDETVVPIKACLQDDIWFIKPDHSMSLLRGAVACNEPGEPTLDQDNAGTWQLSGNDTQFSYTEVNNGETLSGDISKLTTSSFVFKIKSVSGSALSPVEFDVYIQ